MMARRITPTPDRLWQILERHRITTFGVSPTAIRVLMRSSQPGAIWVRFVTAARIDGRALG